MRCCQQAQYLIRKSMFDWSRYLKWECSRSQGKFPCLVDFLDTIGDVHYDIEQTWLNRNVLSLVASYRLLNKPESCTKPSTKEAWVDWA